MSLSLLLAVALSQSPSTLAIDLDGDQVDELVEVSADVRIHFSRTGKTQTTSLTTERASSFTVEFALPWIPASPAREAALRFIEEARFRGVPIADAPDESWLRLQAQRSVKRGRPAPLRWLAGPPVMPETWVLRTPTVWRLYLGQWHGWRKPEPWVAAEDGDRVVMATAHGLILTDAARSRHAWLYVLDQPVEKLAAPTVGRVQLERGAVSFVFFTNEVEAPLQRWVRISLEDGSVTVRDRQADSR